MKDIDFDELDAAVNSVMGNRSVGGSTSASVDSTSSTTPTVKPITAKTVDEVVLPGIEPTVSPRPIARFNFPHRAGKAMDIVHPNSDTSSLRSGPSPNFIKSATKATAAPGPDLLKALGETKETQDSSKTADSLPVQNFSGGGVAVTDAELSSSIDQAPSPFLTNVSLDKRPLGARNNEISEDYDFTKDDSLSDDNLLQGKDNDSDAPIDSILLPEELSKDVLEVESKALTDTMDDATATPAPVSISPQYKARAVPTTDSHQALYDTASITPTVKHPAKKKSGWLSVVIIIGLLIAGAGIGAAIYFSGLI